MAVDTERFLERARIGKRESKNLEFKEQFDPSVEGEWIELLKDFVAIANTGGGVVVVGAANDGTPSGVDVSEVLDLDSAQIGDKLFRYVGENFDDFEVLDVQRYGVSVAAIVIGETVASPLVFGKPGNYTNAAGKQKTAFAKGTVYFRHGAKSEPATGADLRGFIERRLQAIRDEWLGGIKNVITAPEGAEMAVIERTFDKEGQPTRIRVTTDEDAPIYGRIDPDETHPYRQTDLIPVVNKKLPGKKEINTHDMLSVRRTHDIDEKSRPDFVHQPKFASPQYSEAFADWMVGEFKKDADFFQKARDRYYRIQHTTS